MSVRRVGWIPADKSIAGAGYTQDWHITLANLVRVKPGFVRELLGRCTTFFCWMCTQRTQAWRCRLPCWHYVESGNEASREKRRPRKGRKGVPDDIVLASSAPGHSKGRNQCILFWVGENVYHLQVKESYRFTHWPPGVFDGSRDPLARWERRVGRCHWNEIRRALQRTVEEFYFLNWRASMQVFLMLFSVPRMDEKSHQKKFF